MKRSSVACSVLAVLVTASLLPACAADPGEGSGAEGDLVTPGVLQVCIYPQYAPLEYFTEGTGGTITGFDAELARSFGESMGVKTKLVDTAFDSLIPGLSSRRCDMVISGLYVSDERKKVATAVPYLQTGSAIAASPGVAATIAEPNDLARMKIAVQSGSSLAELLATLNAGFAEAGKPIVDIVEYPQTPLALGALLAGKADALLETDVAISDMASKNEGAIESLDDVFPPDQVFGAYFRKDSALADQFASYLEDAVGDGSLAKLAKRNGLNPERLVNGGTK